jgi:hypothetical protein
MTSNIKIPKILKDNEMADETGMRGLIGRKMSQSTKFMGVDIKISKLSVSQVLEIQEAAKETEVTDQGLSLLRKVIKMSVEGADTFTDEDFNNFPMDELSKLSTAIMKFSGISGNESGK